MDWDWGNAGKGAAIGAGAGSVVPGVGTLPGAGVGFLAGGSDWLGFGGGLTGKNAYWPSEVKLSTTRADEERRLGMQTRAQQQQYADWLRDAMEGRGPSVAQQQLAQGTEQAQRAALATAASVRGANPAIAQIYGTQGAAMSAQQASRDAAMLRAQEQMGYSQQYGGALQAQRLQDLQARGYSIEEAKAQLQAQVGEQQMRTEISEGEAKRKQGFLGGLAGGLGGALGLGGLTSDIRAKEDITSASPPTLTDPNALAVNLLNLPEEPSPRRLRSAERYADEWDRRLDAERWWRQPSWQERLGGGLQLLGRNMSDEDAKTEIRALSGQNAALKAALAGQTRGAPTARFGDLTDQAASIPAYTYRYRWPYSAQYGSERQLGPMAQDLERTPATAGAVTTGPDGMKRVDSGKLALATASLVGALARRQQEQEEMAPRAVAPGTVPVSVPMLRRGLVPGVAYEAKEAARRAKERPQFKRFKTEIVRGPGWDTEVTNPREPVPERLYFPTRERDVELDPETGDPVLEGEEAKQFLKEDEEDRKQWQHLVRRLSPGYRKEYNL